MYTLRQKLVDMLDMRRGKERLPQGRVLEAGRHSFDDDESIVICVVGLIRFALRLPQLAEGDERLP